MSDVKQYVKIVDDHIKHYTISMGIEELIKELLKLKKSCPQSINRDVDKLIKRIKD